MILSLIFIINYLFGQDIPPLPKSDHVEQLGTVALFQAAIAPTQNDFYFIAFYQDGCARCQHFIPIMNTLADSIYTTPNLKFGRVNCPQNPEVCNEQKISGLPGLKFFYKGTPVEYEGEKTVSAITTWINDQMAKKGAKVGGASSKTPLPTSEHITQLTATNEIKDSKSDTFWMVVYYREGCQHCARLMPSFVTLADQQYTTPNVKFGRVDCPKSAAVCTADKIDGVPTVRIYYQGDSREYSGARDVDSLTKWFTESIANKGAYIRSPPLPRPPGLDAPAPPADAKPASLPVPTGPLPTSEHIAQLTSVNEIKDVNSNTFWMVVYYMEKNPHCGVLMPNYVKLADNQHTTPNAKFGRVDCPKNVALCTSENIDGVPTIRLYYKGAVSDYLGPRDLNSLTTWYRDSIADDGAHIKSPPPPPAAKPTAEGGLPKSDNVEQLDTVAEFEAAIAPTQRNFYYITFYQDGCPRCQRFIPILNQVSDSISTIPNLKFGRVNCPKNPDVCTKQGISDLPGIKFFYKGTHIDYKGEQTVAAITAWIKDEMANDGVKVTGKKPSDL